MDIVKLHEELINDYKEYVSSFINIQNEELKTEVEKILSDGSLWPAPLMQFNPAYAGSIPIEEFTNSHSELHDDLNHAFKGFKLYQHQVEAMLLGAKNQPFIVTSGTGSGKSLTYIGTLFNHILKNPHSKGVQAIIVYPMNALVNSQLNELRKYELNYLQSKNPYIKDDLSLSLEERIKDLRDQASEHFPINYGIYTGQEGEEIRTKMRQDPPHILLTNYMMLELILTRQKDAAIRTAINENLQYLIFDELHTYRGRQGADVGMLIRRIKAECEYEVTCIGTSATMVSGSGTIEDQKRQVAEVVKQIFSTEFNLEQIINEQVDRSTKGPSPDKSELMLAFNEGIDIDASKEILITHPAVRWLELHAALEQKGEYFVRRKPRTKTAIVEAFASALGISNEQADAYINDVILWISEVNKKQTNDRYTILPYKVHQFISQSGALYSTLDYSYIEVDSPLPKGMKPSYPVVFSRLSGYEFFCCTRDDAQKKFVPRELNEVNEDEEEVFEEGFLIPDTGDIWDEETDLEKLPDSWIKYNKSGVPKVANDKKDHIPKLYFINEEGIFRSTQKDGFKPFLYVPAKLLFDPTAGIVYNANTKNYAKFNRLGAEGRSTATTILSFITLLRKAEQGIPDEEQKLLSFTDNRQDASFQAGHFNDFVKVIRIRSAVYNALKAHKSLKIESLGDKIAEQLSQLNIQEWAKGISGQPRRPVIKKYTDIFSKNLTYQAIYDLKRSWKVILPNLEQCALLKVDYEYIDELLSESDLDNYDFLNGLSDDQRRSLIYQILDYFRTSYALYSDTWLNDSRLSENMRQISESIASDWAISEDIDLQPKVLRLEKLRQYGVPSESIGFQSSLGKYIKEFFSKELERKLSKSEYEKGLVELLGLLEDYDYISIQPFKGADGADVDTYSLKLDSIIWKLGDHKHASIDSVRTRTYKKLSDAPNMFFQKFYSKNFLDVKLHRADEHSAMNKNDERKETETKFRSGEVSALFCSPTMELGIDISSLNTVHMRNVPPNPANYAQRSGRAGRGGQAALVLTYCSNYSAHDRHYFKNSQEMVAGVVNAPKLDLFNKEMFISHLNAMILGEVQLDLNRSIMELVVDDGSYPLKDEVRQKLSFNDVQVQQIAKKFEKIIESLAPDFPTKAPWYSAQWLRITISKRAEALDDSLNRWRNSLQDANKWNDQYSDDLKNSRYKPQSKEHRRLISDVNKTKQRQAELRLDEENKGFSQSEFYVYRYLASEGFLPGYNFTRLPVRVFINQNQGTGVYLSRPRPTALREYGPNNMIYYKGQKYAVTRVIKDNIEDKLERAKIAKNSGYWMQGSNYDLNVCPFSGEDLSSNSKVDFISDLLRIDDAVAEPRERITCEEEERLRQGYDIYTFFTNDPERQDKAVLKSDGEDFLRLRYSPAAELVYVNKGWRRNKDEGFPIGLSTGMWKRSINKESKEEVRLVKLFTTNVDDILFIEPVESLGLNEDGVISLKYALKRAIERVFQVESSEIGVASIGQGEVQNILIYEAAEGSLGILSQLVSDHKRFDEVIKMAKLVCRYEEEPNREVLATYDDLLDFYNQYDHPQINRWLIRDALNKLSACDLEVQTNTQFNSYDTHYQHLLKNYDKNSSTELKFLQYLYKHKLRLPDEAQPHLKGIYAKPDFRYGNDTFVFCDGTPHDQPHVQENDTQIRKDLRNMGYEVIEYYYKDKLEELVSKYPDIFRKVKE